MNDEDLHRLLRQHPAEVSLPRSFQRDVWARIEADDTRSFSALMGEAVNRFFASLARPALASVTLLLFGAAGLGLGWKQYESERDQRAALAYQRVVNPLLHAHSEGRR